MYDAVIIGGGAVGCAVARWLSRYRLRICLLERGEDVCMGTSKANSAICHAGFDAPVGSAKARFNVEGSHMMEALSRQLDFPYRRCGALVLCFNETNIPRLEELKARGKCNGVEGLTILGRDALRRQEPRVSPQAAAALYVPTSAIICPFGMTIALAENAAANGCEFRFDTEVQRIRRQDGGFLLETSRGPLESRTVICAAGVHGDTFHNQLCEGQLHIVPRRGEYCLLDRRDGGLAQHTIFQLPSAMGKGVLVTPTVHGNLLVGPTAEDQVDKGCTATTSAGLRRVAEVPENYEFAGTFNTCDVIAVNAVNRVMAFKFVDGEAELHSNLEPGDFEKTRDELLQKYAVLLLRKTVEQEGKFQVREQETLPDGTVRIKVGRWV